MHYLSSPMWMLEVLKLNKITNLKVKMFLSAKYVELETFFTGKCMLNKNGIKY